jgi:hypothetical protein
MSQNKHPEVKALNAQHILTVVAYSRANVSFSFCGVFNSKAMVVMRINFNAAALSIQLQYCCISCV